MTDQPPELRASDAEREQAVEALRTAATEGRLNVEELEDRVSSAYTVRTRGELASLIADVTVHPIGSAGPVAPARAHGLTVREGPGGDRWVLSIMSGHERKGRWRLAPRCTVLNVMGGSDIDLNDAEVAGPVTQLAVYSIMGGGEVRVPEGVEVEVTNVAIMGGNDVQLGDERPPPGGPLIRIRLVSIMGSASVRRGRRPTPGERKREREQRRAERRELRRAERRELRRAERRERRRRG